MAKYDAQLGDLRNTLQTASSILIVLPLALSTDKLASALSLMLALKQLNKQVTLLSKDTIKVSHTNLFGVGEVKNQIPQSSSKDYILTLEGVINNGQPPALEKLDWYPEGENLNLVFHILPGQKFEPKNVSTKAQSEGYNLIFVIGSSSHADLADIYTSNIQLFSSVPVINIDNDPKNSHFGQYNVVDPNASSISEMVLQIIQSLGLNLDPDSASNLLAGIYDATANLSQNPNPETFLAVSTAMQAGGKLPQPQMQPTPTIQFTPQGAPLAPTPIQSGPAQDTATTNPNLRQIFQLDNQPQGVVNPPIEPVEQSKNYEETPSGEFATSRNPEGTEFSSSYNPQPNNQPSQSETDSSNPAPDWLTPKIYKGGGGLG